ncbi:related to cycloheximide-inducible protein CIP70 (cytochrome P450 family) [Cephalotrichum gorgonifer]|uniref:Related to cycloheximide-inducible protein CIP70 (Cytochrome P450 family) n=1 Tax=Cephalotrichum gorgonifer TaxID=2041049 RepID=A0AAE8MUD5_9PEZI|nr:related to cycloheximide-inducible protein CIP70 (cytochrome P450 family) [Cephalotrichum gorgonifer]
MGLEEAVEALADRWPLFAVGAATLVGASLVRHLYYLKVLYSIPVLGEELGGKEKRRAAYLMGARKLYLDGYKQFKDTVYRITTTKDSHTTIVVSPKFLTELQKLPDDVVSFQAAVNETIEAKHTKLGTESAHDVARSVKSDLTPALVRLNPTIAEEVNEAMDLELPIGADWTEININKALLRIVGMVSGRIFIGPELCREEEYLDASINYTIDVMTAVREINTLRWFRDLRAPYLPSVKKLKGRVKQALNFLQPVVQKRMAMARDDVKTDRPDDMLQWFMEGKLKKGAAKAEDVDYFARVQLGLSFAAIHTTTLTTTNAFYSLAATPEIVPELRAEIREVLAESGGLFTSAALQKMKKLDSFLRETSRLYPPSHTSFQRKALKNITLSNGQVIPAGVLIEVAAVGVNHDPAIHADDATFDPLRFYRPRSEAEAESGAAAGAANQFVSVNQAHLTFGYGRHACPGRFFAANEIKMIMANALLRYDVRNVDGVEGRIPNLEFGNINVPDGSKSLLFRKVPL